MNQRCVQVLGTALTERILFLVNELLIQTAQESLVVYTHSLQEVHLKLLAVTAELGSQTITLALQLLLRDLQCSKLIKSLLALHNFRVRVLVVSDHPIDLDLILSDHSLQFMAFSLALASITLILEGHINCILLIREAIKLIVTRALRLRVGVSAVLKR